MRLMPPVFMLDCTVTLTTVATTKRHYIVIEGNSSVIKKILSPWSHKIEKTEKSRLNPKTQTLYPTEETITEEKAEEAFYNLIKERARKLGILVFDEEFSDEYDVDFSDEYWELFSIKPPHPSMLTGEGEVELVLTSPEGWVHWQIDGDKFLQDDWEIYLTPKE